MNSSWNGDRTYQTGHGDRGMKNNRKVNNTAKQMLLPNLTAYRAGEASGYQHSKRVGPYMIGRLLGEGSFAKVREAMHTVVGEKVAIKIIDKKEAQTDFYIHKHLRREAAILQQLRHPNIVCLLEVLETDNNLYMVLEICNGGPLLDLIWVQQGLSEDDAKRFTQQVISAVQYLHNVGIMHRDLKVENLLLDEDRNIKLIDFGLSSFHLPTCEALSIQSVSTFYDRNMSATLCGSPAYAAPEIISQKSYSPKVDVWSIGINTFAMLTATLPFLVEPFNLRLLLRKMINGQMSELPSNVSEECEDFVRYMLQPDPSMRPTIHDAGRHPWLGKGTTPTPSAPLRRLSLMEVENDIIYDIRETLGIDPAHVMESVLARKADEFSALYHLMYIKKQRHWRRDISDVKRSFHKITMDIGHGADVQDVINYTTTLELARKKQGSPHYQVVMGMRSASDTDRVRETDTKFHDIYHEVLHSDDTKSALVPNSEKKIADERRKISDQRSHTTSVASGNPWVGLMGREMSFIGAAGGDGLGELVESFKITENKRKMKTKQKAGNGVLKRRQDKVRGQRKVISTNNQPNPTSQVVPIFKPGKGAETNLQLSTIGESNLSSKREKEKVKKDNSRASMESLQWNGDILRSKSKTNILDKKGSQKEKKKIHSTLSSKINIASDVTNDAKNLQEVKRANQKATAKKKPQKKVGGDISRLYGTNRKASLAVFQNRSKDKHVARIEVVNIHEAPKAAKKTTTNKNVNLTGVRLTKRAKNQGNKTILSKRGRRKSTANQHENKNCSTQERAEKTEDRTKDALPNVTISQLTIKDDLHP